MLIIYLLSPSPSGEGFRVRWIPPEGFRVRWIPPEGFRVRPTQPEGFRVRPIRIAGGEGRLSERSNYPDTHFTIIGTPEQLGKLTDHPHVPP